MQTEDSNRTSPRYVHVFDTMMEIVVSTLPLVLVVLGIGMMSFSPRRSAVPLFRSTAEAQQFFTENGLQFSSDTPIVLVASKCPTCSSLTGSLKQLGIPYVEQNIDTIVGAAALRAQAEKVSGSQALPQVVLGDHLINPAPYSVKIALKRAQK
jgi:glutaredoxin